ncbi:putative Modin [Fusarium austroafricanum]|uniref:Putative Modin n=1 Tax=Fusarium austroafricanum TaxID=2364996 RepID=A0A8H4KJX7_9HYPO|nr:putative Modin [Fusarium austroafricanum]
MSSTATAVPDSGGGGSSDDNAELIIAVVALVISILAFVIAILQALQQYLATATGWSSCSEAVIGKWHNFARRKMVWTELRFDVQFEAPVIFVARPSNTRGPLGDDALAKDESKKIIRLDGSPDNFKYTDTTAEFNDEYKQSTLKKVIHTADNEKATWYALLMAIVRMEQESREWQCKKSTEYNEWIKKAGPRQIETEEPHAHHSLLVMMQRKRRTWDSMPKDFAKPYATTTISHIVEIAGMLGIHWRQFDLNNDQYRAQGNGFVIYGSYTDGLGITFNFQKQGPTWFEKNRVVPSYNVKQLCFGMAPTIFTNQEKKVYADEAKGAESLQLGSFAEIAKTLVVFGCDINTVNYFRVNTDQARHSHLFAGKSSLIYMIM